MSIIPLSDRQRRIAEMVRQTGPITGDKIAGELGLTRAALRSDLAILIMSGILDARPRVGYYYTGKNTLGMLQEENSYLKVRDIQSVPTVIDGGKCAHDAAITMFMEDVGTVFVLGEDGLLQGVVSRKDLLKPALNTGTDLHKLPIPMVMTPLSKIVVVEADDSIATAARRLIDNEVDCMPVVRYVDGDRKKMETIGRVTKTNFTRLLVDLAEGKGGNYHS